MMNPTSPDQAWANLDRDLRGFFDFSEDDLAANQQGQLTPRQIKRIEALIRSLNFEDTAYFCNLDCDFDGRVKNLGGCADAGRAIDLLVREPSQYSVCDWPSMAQPPDRGKS